MNAVPRNDIYAEKAIIGTMLIDKDSIPYIITTIEDKYFYDDRHEIVFKAIKKLVKQCSNVDLIMLKNALEGMDIIVKLGNGKEIVDKFKKENLLDQIGGLTYLAELTEECYSGNIKDYCKIVKECYIIREYGKLSSYISNGIDNNLDIKGIGDIVEKQLKVINSMGVDDSTQDMMSIMMQHYESLANSLEGDDTDIKRVKTGFKELDEIIGSMHGGDLIVIAAGSSIGKSMTSLNILNNITKIGKRGLLFTMEMNNNKISDILLTMNSNIKYQTLQTWNDQIVTYRNKLLLAQDRLEEGIDKDDKHIKTINKEIDRLIEHKQNILMDNMEYIDEIANRQLYIDDDSGTTTRKIRNKIMELSIKDQLDLVVIDQLSLMSGEGKGIRERYDIITGELKQMAREYNVPIILIVQLLGKELGKRPGHEPRNEDIKESYKIYEDADKVLLLNRKSYRDQQDGKELNEFSDMSMDVFITKNRGGTTSQISLSCDLSKQKLTDLSDADRSKKEF